MNSHRICLTNKSSYLRGSMVGLEPAKRPSVYNAPSATIRWSRSSLPSPLWPRLINEYQTGVACNRLSAWMNMTSKAVIKRDRKFVPCKFTNCNLYLKRLIKPPNFHSRISATPPGQRTSMSANRAVSFRERRNVLDSNFNQVAPPVVKRQPLSQNNFQQLPSQPSQQHSHAYVNLLHQQDQQYNNYQNYHSNINNNNFSVPSNNSSLNSSSLHHYELSHLNSSTASSNVNTSMNSSWNSYSNSPNASLYAQQQQYYIRPRTSSCSKKVPPEVPKRTSSIQNTPPKYQQSHMHHHGKHHHHHHHHPPPPPPQQQQQFVQGKSSSGQFYKTENGNHSSPSSADSLSLSSNSPVPNVWQQQASIEQQQILHQQYLMEQKQLQQQLLIQQQNELQLQAKLSETIRKRQYRIGLNLFNKKPEKGITYLMHKNFLENSPHAVAKFLISRKGLSRQMIGEYLGNLQQSFNMAVLEYFAEEMDFSGLAIDVALKKFQGYFRMPGEAQKIERLMEIFSHRYGTCNPDVIEKLRSPDTVSGNWIISVRAPLNDLWRPLNHFNRFFFFIFKRFSC